jgi:hypothetical protein
LEIETKINQLKQIFFLRLINGLSINMVVMLQGMNIGASLRLVCGQKEVLIETGTAKNQVSLRWKFYVGSSHKRNFLF